MTDTEKVELAAGALADIAYATDMTLRLARKKADRIYRILRADELAEEAREIGETHCEICAPQEKRLQGYRCRKHTEEGR
jgi:hypothetical protein